MDASEAATDPVALEKAQSRRLVDPEAEDSAAPPAPAKRRRALISCCALLLLVACSLGAVAANYASLARCLHIEVLKMNTTSLCNATIHSRVQLATHSPSLFGLQLGETRVRIDVLAAGERADAARPAASAVVPPFALAAGSATLSMTISLTILDADALGDYLNRSANGEAGSALRVAVRTTVASRALWGLPLSLPFSTVSTIPSAPRPPPDPGAAARREGACGSGRGSLLSFPLQVSEASHAAEVLRASKSRMHVAGIFDALLASPVHHLRLPGLSTELCVLDGPSGALRSFAQVSTRAGSLLQSAELGPSDAVVDALVLTESVEEEHATFAALSQLVEDSLDGLYLRGSTDAEVERAAAGAAASEPKNGASSACPLQRALQRVSYKVPGGLLDAYPQAKAMAQFGACAWQRLHKLKPFSGEAPPPSDLAAQCAPWLHPAVDGLVPGLLDKLEAFTGTDGPAAGRPAGGLIPGGLIPDNPWF